MNTIRQIQSLNKRELENAVPPEASWHADYRDTAYIYIGGLPYDLSEGDVVTIFSQFGEPVHVNLVRDKETGKSRGFAFLKYEDQRSTDLAVDNLGGATVLGRILRVDHVRYKRREDEGEEDNIAQLLGETAAEHASDRGADGERQKRRRGDGDVVEERRRPLLKEEIELEKLIRDHDEEDPMKEFLIEEKKEEVSRALEKWKSEEKKSRRRDDSRDRSSRHQRHHRHRRHREHRSRSRERSHRANKLTSRDERSYRDKSPSRERSYRERSPRRSRSPDARQHGDRSDRRR